MANTFRTYGYNYHYPENRITIPNPLIGIEVDYYFMASRFAGSKTEVSITLWTVVVDEEGFVYGLMTFHNGHYEGWDEMIRDRIKEHLIKLNVDALFVKRLVRDLEIKKEGHLIPRDRRVGGTFIGIDGSSELYVRRDRFTYLK